MSVLIHAATAVGLFLVLRQMTGRLWPPAMTAALFAIHPLRVESVAWISERRDVLSGLFFVLTLWAYAHYARRPRDVGKYITLCLLFTLGLLAKPMLVTIPPLLLLLDYWPLQRKDPLGRLLVEKVPLLVISLVACLITFYTQSDGGAVQSLQSVSLAARVANTPIAYADYVGSFFWPRRLAVLYPHPCDDYDVHDAIVKACFLIVGSAVIGLLWRRMPYLLVGWLWYLGMLVPVIGLLQVGGASMADRYTYLPQIGLAIAVVWSMTATADKLCGTDFIPSVEEFESVPQATVIASAFDSPAHLTHDSASIDENPAIELPATSSEPYRANRMESVRQRGVHGFVAIGSTLILAALGIAAWRQTSYWRNCETLWTRELSFPEYDNAVAHYNFGLNLAEQNRHSEAVHQFEAALAKDPKDESSHLTAGASYEALGSADAAIRHYRAMIGDNPKSVSGLTNLARLLQARGDDREAVEHLRAAHEEEPSNQTTCSRLALLLATSPQAGVRNAREALSLGRRAVELSGGKDAAALDARAAAEAESGDLKAAAEDAQAALKLATTDKKAADEIRQRLKCYRAGRPFRSTVAHP